MALLHHFFGNLSWNCGWQTAALAVAAVVILWAASPAKASCGDYVQMRGHLRPPGYLISTGTTAWQSDAPSDSSRRPPCHGPACERQRSLPVIPAVPMKSGPPNDAVVTCLAAAGIVGASAAGSSTPPAVAILPAGHVQRIEHPPRV